MTTNPQIEPIENNPLENIITEEVWQQIKPFVELRVAKTRYFNVPSNPAHSALIILHDVIKYTAINYMVAIKDLESDQAMNHAPPELMLESAERRYGESSLQDWMELMKNQSESIAQ